MLLQYVYIKIHTFAIKYVYSLEKNNLTELKEPQHLAT